jgi:hypothetical protein
MRPFPPTPVVLLLEEAVRGAEGPFSLVNGSDSSVATASLTTTCARRPGLSVPRLAPSRAEIPPTTPALPYEMFVGGVLRPLHPVSPSASLDAAPAAAAEGEGKGKGKAKAGKGNRKGRRARGGQRGRVEAPALSSAAKLELLFEHAFVREDVSLMEVSTLPPLTHQTDQSPDE